MNKLLFNSLMRKVFLALLLHIGIVFSDVVRLPIGDLNDGFPAHGNTPDQNTFAWAIKNNSMPHPDNFPHDINWQMLGYAAFFPNVGDEQLYLAKKRPFVPGVASNDPGDPPNFANLFNYATSIHTERQLIIAALLNPLTELPVVQVGDQQANVIVGGLNIPNVVNVAILAGSQQLQGNLHVYTAQNPCQNRTEENGNFSCIDYYNALANFIQGLNLHIYFPGHEMRLNKAFFNGNDPACQALCVFIQNNLVTGFQIEGGWLQCKRNEQWINLVQQTSTGWEVRRNAKIGILVTQINNAIMNSLFSALQLDQLFNYIHNTANVVRIKYHPID